MTAAATIDRALLALGIIAAGLALYWLINRLLILRAQSSGAPLPGALPGIPAVLYFTTPGCVPCKTVQRPAIQRLKGWMGDQVQVIEVNAAEQPDLASRWGVMSVPTTFIIDSKGKLKHVNHGVTRAEKLAEQLEWTDFEI